MCTRDFRDRDADPHPDPAVILGVTDGSGWPDEEPQPPLERAEPGPSGIAATGRNP
jgi:hypothetical protein